VLEPVFEFEDGDEDEDEDEDGYADGQGQTTLRSAFYPSALRMTAKGRP
jgi:hypothetical protein